MSSILKHAQQAAARSVSKASPPSSSSDDESDFDSDMPEAMRKKKRKLTKETEAEPEEEEEEAAPEEEEEEAAPEEEEEEVAPEEEEEAAPEEEEEVAMEEDAPEVPLPVKVTKKKKAEVAPAAPVKFDPLMPFGEGGHERFLMYSGKGHCPARPVCSNEIFVDKINNLVWCVVSNPPSGSAVKTKKIKGETKPVWSHASWEQHFVAAQLDTTVAEAQYHGGCWKIEYKPKFKGAPESVHGPPLKGGDQYRETFVHCDDNKIYPINSTGSGLMMTARKDLSVGVRRGLGAHARSTKSNLAHEDVIRALRTKGNYQIAGHLIAVMMPYYRFRFELANVNAPPSPKPAAAATPSRKRSAPSSSAAATSASSDLKTAPSSLVQLVNVLTEKRCMRLIEEAVASCRAQASEKSLSERFLEWCHGLFKLYQTSKDKPDPDAALERRIRKYATTESPDGVDTIQKMEVVATRHYLVSNPIGTALMEAQYNRLLVLETGPSMQDEEDEDDGLNV